jgi:uncharacterized protein (AIM24 family)
MAERRMTVHSLDDFLSRSGERPPDGDAFALENARILQAQVDGLLWAKAGAMVARTGDLRFTRQGLLEQGLGTLFKKAISGEGMHLMRVEGRGRVYLADAGKKITLLRLQGEPISVNGRDVLALESSVAHEIGLLRGLGGFLGAGLFNMRLDGHGLVAITSHFEPLTLPVSAATGPVFTDPDATVAWSGGLSPELVTDLSLRSFVGRASGESLQLKFAGEGWVVVQSCEDAAPRSRIPPPQG